MPAPNASFTQAGRRPRPVQVCDLSAGLAYFGGTFLRGFAGAAGFSAFAGALETLPRPVLFYCRSGTRCTLLWAQASAARIGAAEAIAVAGQAGYDLTSIADILEERETPVAPLPKP